MAEIIGALILYLIGGWVLAVPFYGFALYALFKREWQWLFCWLGVFGVMVGWALYDGVYRRTLFNERAAKFSQVVHYAELPRDVRTIAYIDLTSQGEAGHNGCGNPCLNLLLSGRFDRVVLWYRNRSASNPGSKLEAIRAGTTIPDHYYAVFELTAAAGADCTALKSSPNRAVLNAWERAGHCVVRSQVATLDAVGPRIEVRLNDDAPANPPWPVKVIDVRHVDGKEVHLIGRAESADIFLSRAIPWPVIYAQGFGLKPEFGIGLIPERFHYGPTISLYPILSQILGLPLEPGRLGLPALSDQPPEGRLEMARHILFRAPALERNRFIKSELAAMRPLEPAYRQLILEALESPNLKPYGARYLGIHLAWLAAGDPALGPAVAARFVDRASEAALREQPGATYYLDSLRYFGRDMLEPHAERLLALAERPMNDATQDREIDAFHAALNLALGGAGPAAVPRLIEELNVGANEGNRRPAAAVSLCRIGDPRAAEPLIERVTRRGWSISMSMSPIYALVRLGRIEEAKAAMARYRPRPSAERSCFEEIVEKFPDGGAPESICLIQGPHEKPDRRYSESAIRCLAPTTPAEMD